MVKKQLKAHYPDKAPIIYRKKEELEYENAKLSDELVNSKMFNK